MEFKPVNVWKSWNSRILSLNMVASKEADKKLIYILFGFLTWKFRVFRLSVLYFLVLWMLPIYTKFLFSFNLWKICFRIAEPNCNLLRRNLFCYFMVPNTPIYWKNHCWIWKSLILARDLQELFDLCIWFSCQKSVCWIISISVDVVAMISFCCEEMKIRPFKNRAMWNIFRRFCIQIFKLKIGEPCNC